MRGGAGQGEDQGHLVPEHFLGEWVCLKVAVWHVWHEANRRDSFPEVHTWFVGQLCWDQDFSRMLPGGRSPALRHRALEYIPGKGKGNTGRVTSSACEGRGPTSPDFLVGHLDLCCRPRPAVVRLCDAE